MITQSKLTGYPSGTSWFWSCVRKTGAAVSPTEVVEIQEELVKNLTKHCKALLAGKGRSLSKHFHAREDNSEEISWLAL